MSNFVRHWHIFTDKTEETKLSQKHVEWKENLLRCINAIDTIFRDGKMGLSSLIQWIEYTQVLANITCDFPLLLFLAHLWVYEYFVLVVQTINLHSLNV